MTLRRDSHSEMLARGVYELGARTTADEIILIAVNSRGQRIAERCVSHERQLRAAWSALEALLDRVDPAPRRAFEVG